MEQVLRAFLHRNPAQKQHQLFAAFDARFAHRPVPVSLDTVIDDVDLLGAEAVTTDHDATGEMTHGNDLVGPLHALPLDIIHDLVDMLTASVELGRMNVHDQRLAGHGGHRHPGRIRHPVVSVNHVELFALRQLHRHGGIAMDLLIHIATVIGGLLHITARRPLFRRLACQPPRFLHPLVIRLRRRIRLQR